MKSIFFQSWHHWLCYSKVDCWPGFRREPYSSRKENRLFTRNRTILRHLNNDPFSPKTTTRSSIFRFPWHNDIQNLLIALNCFINWPQLYVVVIKTILAAQSVAIFWRGDSDKKNWTTGFLRKCCCFQILIVNWRNFAYLKKRKNEIISR